MTPTYIREKKNAEKNARILSRIMYDILKHSKQIGLPMYTLYSESKKHEHGEIVGSIRVGRVGMMVVKNYQFLKHWYFLLPAKCVKNFEFSKVCQRTMMRGEVMAGASGKDFVEFAMQVCINRTTTLQSSILDLLGNDTMKSTTAKNDLRKLQKWGILNSEVVKQAASDFVSARIPTSSFSER